jgi:hypothetical protein
MFYCGVGTTKSKVLWILAGVMSALLLLSVALTIVFGSKCQDDLKAKSVFF